MKAVLLWKICVLMWLERHLGKDIRKQHQMSARNQVPGLLSITLWDTVPVSQLKGSMTLLSLYSNASVTASAASRLNL